MHDDETRIPTADGGTAPKPKKRSNVVLIILVLCGLGFFGVTCAGILAAIAIPNYFEFQERARQAEAKVNLEAICSAERAYQIDRSRWGASFAAIDFQPESGHRYSYFIGNDAIRSKHGPVASPVASRVDAAGFKAVAAGNIDDDPTIDVWVIDQDGTLTHVVNDIKE